jgi:streptomycin 6-kinase
VGHVIEVPASFLAQPRWWRGGQTWLSELPARVEAQCRRWALELDGPVMHGSNALVVPVRRGPLPLALRLTPPEDDVAAEVRALRFWDGRGTVALLDADEAVGATLLERLDGTRSLQLLPLGDAVPVLGQLMRRLAVPAPASARGTDQIAATRAAAFEADWGRLGRPFSRAVLDRAVRCAGDLCSTTSDLAVNGDLHFEQVLAAGREPWLCVDPVLYRGDIDYDLARILWSRLDEMNAETIDACFATLVAEAGLDPDRARAWVLFRAVDYWLWGLDHDLTEDPVRCHRLVQHFR